MRENSDSEEVTRLLFSDNMLLLCKPELQFVPNNRCAPMLSRGFWSQGQPDNVRIGSDWRQRANFARILGYRVTYLPLKYVGLPLNAKFKDTSIWDDPITNKFEARLVG